MFCAFARFDEVSGCYDCWVCSAASIVVLAMIRKICSLLSTTSNGCISQLDVSTNVPSSSERIFCKLHRLGPLVPQIPVVRRYPAPTCIACPALRTWYHVASTLAVTGNCRSHSKRSTTPSLLPPPVRYKTRGLRSLCVCKRIFFTNLSVFYFALLHCQWYPSQGTYWITTG